MRNRNTKTQTTEAGFSLIELLIAMTLVIGIAAIGSTLLSSSFNIRTRENARTDSIADVQRALNTMARELAIGGYGFDSNANGLVAGDCDNSVVRVRSNLNRYTNEATKYTIADTGEDLKYFIDVTNGQYYLVRYDRFAPAGNQTTVLANRVDNLDVIYWSPTNTVLDVVANPSQVVNAVGLRITVTVNLPAVGSPNTAGYQPPTSIQLSSDVALRNKEENLETY